MVKPFHAGHCGRNGRLAAQFAQRGFDANAFALKHHQGFLNVFNGAGTFDPEKLLQDWASPLEIEGETATARALLDGVVRLRHFEGSAQEQPEILTLLKTTQAKPQPGMPDDAEEQWGAEVTVTLHNGQRQSRRVDQLVGRGGKSAMTRDKMCEGFEDCAGRSLPRERLHQVFEMLEGQESVGDVNELRRLLQPAARAQLLR